MALTNRLVIDKAITVRSVNGAGVTRIEGAGPNGPSAIRCVWMVPAAELHGFTLSGGATLAGLTDDSYGGGVYRGTLRRCTLVGNQAYQGGGGAAGAVLHESMVVSNQAASGGGIYATTAINSLLAGNHATNIAGGAHGGSLFGCTVTDNHADASQGGVFNSVVRNSILYFNSAPTDPNYNASSSLRASCATPLASGEGNITNNPQFVDAAVANYRVVFGSPCIGTGSNDQSFGATDLAGNPRILGARVDIGAYEAPLRASTFNRDGVITIVDNNFAIPNPSVIRVGGVTGAVATIRVTLHGLQHTWPDDLDIILVSPPFIEGVMLMSDAGGSHDLTNAVITFDDAAAQSLPDETPITNGVYRPTDYETDTFTGITFVTNLTTLLSGGVNGDWSLFIYDDTAGDTGSLAAWELEFEWFIDPTQHYASVFSSDPAWPYITPANAATTIQDAVDAATAGDVVRVGGGVYETGGRPAPGFALTNRVLIDKPIRVESESGPSFTTIRGAGPIGDGAVRGVWLADGASLVGFTVTDGATRSVVLEPDGNGGGVSSQGGASVVSRCRIIGNTADSDGGNVSGGRIENSLLAGGSAFAGGGANFFVVAGRLDNCTVVGNYAIQGGGLYNGVANNCLFGGNSSDTALSDLFYSCGPTFDLDASPILGPGTIIANPVFINAGAGDYRLHPSSPGLEAGDSASAAGLADLDDNPRIIGNQVDMGAFEYIGFIVDSDGDTFTDYEEYVAGTQETNAASYFQSRIVRFGDWNPEVEYTVVSGRVYTIEGATNLMPPAVWSTKLIFTANVDSVFTTVMGTQTTEFRRVKVRLP